jgi:hypothetical protein
MKTKLMAAATLLGTLSFALLFAFVQYRVWVLMHPDAPLWTFFWNALF